MSKKECVVERRNIGFQAPMLVSIWVKRVRIISVTIILFVISMKGVDVGIAPASRIIVLPVSYMIMLLATPIIPLVRG